MKSWKTIILTSLVAIGIGCGSGSAYAQSPGQKAPHQPSHSVYKPVKGPKAEWSHHIAPKKEKDRKGQVRVRGAGKKSERQAAQGQQRYSPRYSFNSPNGGYHSTRPNSHSGKAWR